MREASLAGDRLITSRLGFGTSSLHHLLTHKARARLLEHALDLGIRYFDTAPLYGHELAERELGALFVRRNPEIVIATKFGIASDIWQRMSPALLYGGIALSTLQRRFNRRSRMGRSKDFRAQQMLLSLNRSLRNLQRDHVDILFLHEPEAKHVSLTTELLEAIAQARAAGKIRFFGASGDWRVCASLAQRYPDVIDIIQVNGAGPSPKAWQSLPGQHWPAVTFGHLRQSPGPQTRTPRAAHIAAWLEDAAACNPQGVILVSTRSQPRLSSVAATLGDIDARLRS